VLQRLALVTAWIVGLAIVLAEAGLLFFVLRKIVRNSLGRPRRRAVHLSGFAFTLLLLWSVSRLVP
jgi:hypothetical protein